MSSLPASLPADLPIRARRKAVIYVTSSDHLLVFREPDYPEAGIQPPGGTVIDGETVAAAEEERFSRHKHDPRLPARAFRFCLEQGGITLADVYAALAYYFDNRQEIEDEFRKDEAWGEWAQANCPPRIPAELRKKVDG